MTVLGVVMPHDSDPPDVEPIVQYMRADKYDAVIEERDLRASLIAFISKTESLYTLRAIKQHLEDLTI